MKKFTIKNYQEGSGQREKGMKALKKSKQPIKKEFKRIVMKKIRLTCIDQKKDKRNAMGPTWWTRRDCQAVYFSDYISGRRGKDTQPDVGFIN